MKNVITPLLLCATLFTACKKDAGNDGPEEIVIRCKGGSGQYQIIYTTSASGGRKYVNGSEAKITLEEGETLKANAMDLTLYRAFTLQLQINGAILKEDAQLYPAIEYSNK